LDAEEQQELLGAGFLDQFLGPGELANRAW
jgi:hypothetical protein